MRAGVLHGRVTSAGCGGAAAVADIAVAVSTKSLLVLFQSA